jgi:hypothetical protein
MTTVQTPATYGDLEPLLRDTKNAAYLLNTVLEDAFQELRKSIGEDANDAILYACTNVLDCAARAESHWFEAHKAAHQKKAA